MTPTLFGRIQTRLFLLATFGLLWTLLVTPALPRPDGVTLGEMYTMTVVTLVLVGVIGVVWELIYHGLQQYRWEKDWPSLFGLLNGINEGLVLWALVEAFTDDDLPELAFTLHFATTWVLLWLIANGPMRVFLIRWRFRGGRIV